ncbi:restriction endonuclease [Cylindrospermum stagnale PCC 7417]|uniref:Restriction endonuclease n=1 Tax=Cylindrospermum stagnale PCC 7417 TaxID=56107 RepID=K9WQQ9_9NOST|nr:HNH endonuclease signature motif containing protein [Cylindrospermum stagnale]AFZ22523.1 restriction endonuclease [Cylindrospermum stagnale PCC 7417]
MSGTYIPAALRRLVEERAKYRCEYCLLPAGVSFFPHEIDHVIAEKHNGATNADNLALTCWRCNRYKGTDLGSFDPETGAFSFLFNPRNQEWVFHFTFSKLVLVGLTPQGRTTVKLLQINSEERLAERQRLQSTEF